MLGALDWRLYGLCLPFHSWTLVSDFAVMSYDATTLFFGPQCSEFEDPAGMYDVTRRRKD
jgi:hypothetical protein